MTREELKLKICDENWISDDCCNAFVDGWEEADKHPDLSLEILKKHFNSLNKEAQKDFVIWLDDHYLEED